MKRPEYAVLEAWLRQKGLKMTVPRRVVLEAFLSLESHVTAEQILDTAKRIDPRIGQATVFRTIHLLVDAGLAREAGRDGAGRRWEHAYRHEHHDHLVCLSCGKVVEFQDKRIEEAQASVYASHGFQAVEHSLELRGICADCAASASGLDSLGAVVGA